ncbi:putative receptor-type tyrosine-protein phosphatase mosPTP-1 isoform X1 [Diabrotica undecimpunctata]|uniref:putative receptor-type tyrosine-protein phosphatase mosPTP-1 isoform X1 n=2 Tax=Diabrotica undecimpunctata TaxID=50387 RepID=UPI003B63DA89
MFKIYIYWVCVLVASVSSDHRMEWIRRHIDVTTLRIKYLMVKAGENASLECMGANELTLVTELSWYSLKGDNIVLDYSRGILTVFTDPARLYVARDYSIVFEPALAVDSAKYICLINGRPEPEGVFELQVQDISEPPGRVLVTGFTSRTANLTWYPPRDEHFSPVIYYVVHQRMKNLRNRLEWIFLFILYNNKNIACTVLLILNQLFLMSFI